MRETTFVPSQIDHNLKTGHEEIDRQHEQLNALAARLDAVCEVACAGGSVCGQCPAAHHRQCGDRLAELISQLLDFMVRHFAYEERLMRLLPDTAVCRQHVEMHQLAHAELSRLLSELTFELDRRDPGACATRLRNIVHGWMGGHTEQFDNFLVGTLEHAYDAEIQYDIELTHLLTDPEAPLHARR